MFWYSIIFIIPIIVALTGNNDISLKREQFDESLRKMNSLCINRIICGVIAIVFALLPIIDNLIGPTPDDNYKYITASRIFGCDYSEDGPLLCLVFAWICAIIGVVLIVINLELKRTNYDKLERLVNEEESKQAKIAAKKATEQEEDDVFLAELSAKYGRPEKIVHPLNNRMKNAFIVFPQTQTLYVATQVIPFVQLLNCEIKDETYTTVTGTKEEVTKSSNGSTVGRAIVGGLIAGPAGAIIGGTTSKKTTEIIDNTKTITHHHYYAIINLTSAVNPIITVDCGKFNAMMAEEIKAIVMGIIARRNPSSSSISIADELSKLAMLKDQGVLTQIEFDQQKQLLLALGSQQVESVSILPMNDETNKPIILENKENSEVIDLIDQGRYLEAIQLYQNDSGCDMAEAMNHVNDLMKQMGL